MNQTETTPPTTDNHQVTMRDPADLRIHPILAAMPRMAEDSTQFGALADDIGARGVIEPLKITADDQIVDGRHRFLAAKRQQLAAVPTMLVQDDQVLGMILATLIHRRHYGKGAIGYIAYPFLQEAHEEAVDAAREKIAKNLKTGKNTNVSRESTQWTLGVKRVEDFADRLGICRATYMQAAQVHKLFEDHPDFKADMEPQILDPDKPIGLGAVIQGWAGFNSTAGKERYHSRPVHNFEQSLAGLAKRSARWAEWSEDQQGAAVKAIRNTVASMQIAVCKVMEKELQARIKAEG